MDEVDIAIIGAGVVGLACAATLAASGRSVIVIERNARVGEETSSRNSGVIHAGLYYPTDSWKARLCVRGRDLLYARAARQNIPHQRIGKLIVARDADDLAALDKLAKQAEQNGVDGMQRLDARDVARLEPRVRAVGGLLSSHTGIVDVHALMASYLAQARAHDAELVLHTNVEAIERTAAGYRVQTRNAGGDTFAIDAACVVNAAGLFATEIARRAGVDVKLAGYEQRFCKGDYFRLSARLRGLTQHLVYPLPTHAGLGVHLTHDLGGGMLAGPDTEYVDAPRFDIAEEKRARFGEALRRYLPEVRDEDLTADYAGIRPKLQGPGESFRDFVIEEATAHGLPRFIDLIGIESPGLTASEAIAERVTTMLDD